MELKKLYMYYFFLSGTAIKTLKIFIVMDILFLILFPIILSIQYLKKEKKKISVEISIVFIILISYIFQSIIFKKNLIQEMIYLIPNIIFYLYVYYNQKDKVLIKDYKIILGVTIIFLLVSVLNINLSIIGINNNKNIYYSNGIFNSVIGIGVYSFIGFFLSDAYIKNIQLKNILKFFCTFTLLSSNTRGAMIGLIVYFVFSNGLRLKNTLKYIVIGLFSLIIAINLELINIDKILNKYGNKRLDLMTGRPAIWKESYYYYLEESIMGSGVGHYNLIENLKQKGYPANLHNGYLDILFSAGLIVGFVIIIWIIFKIIKIVEKKYSSKNKLEIRKLAFILAVLVLNLGESLIFFTRVPIAFLFWNFLGNLEFFKMRKSYNSNIKRGKNEKKNIISNFI